MVPISKLESIVESRKCGSKQTDYSQRGNLLLWRPSQIFKAGGEFSEIVDFGAPGCKCSKTGRREC